MKMKLLVANFFELSWLGILFVLATPPTILVDGHNHDHHHNRALKSYKAEHTRCGTPNPTTEARARSDAIVIAWMAKHPKHDRTLQSERIDIPLYYHVITSSDGTGAVTDATLEESTLVLNEAFNPYGFFFIQTDADTTANDSWYGSIDLEGDGAVLDAEMKAALKKGGKNEVDVYISSLFMFGGFDSLGYSSFPDEVESPSGLAVDGVVVNTFTLPGGSFEGLNEGKTLVHEMGHWLGLLHTFGDDGACQEFPGDLIDDTPAQLDESFGCPVGRDSCPDHPGLDPIHNYMDYSDDFCLTEFSLGQEVRMRALWDEYRRVDVPTSPPPTASPTMLPTTPIVTPVPTMMPTTPRVTPVPTMTPTTARVTPVPTMTPTTAKVTPVPTMTPTMAPIMKPTPSSPTMTPPTTSTTVRCLRGR